MRILLVNPPTLYRGKTIEELSQTNLIAPSTPYYKRLLGADNTKRKGVSTLPGEHLGLQSLQATLEKFGHETVVLNACVELHTNLPQTLKQIEEYSFDVIGFTGPLDVFSENLWLARNLRESGYTGHITLGHDFATLNHERILSLFPEFDSVVRGEGEITMLELANALEQKRPLKEVQGLSFRDGAGIAVNSPRPVISNLDEFPWVTRYDLPAILGLKMSASIFTKRGCPYQCSFCTTGIVPLQEGLRGRERWRQRSAKDIVDEVEFLVDTFGISSLTIVDDLYLSKGSQGAQHALEVAEELLERQLRVSYMIDCRVDSIDRSIFKFLKKSGLRKAFIGVESASEVALDTFRKGYKPQIIKEKLHILEELDIEYILGYIMFNPLETIEGLEQSYQLVNDLDRHDHELFLQSVRIYPGTHLHRDLERRGLLVGKFPYFTAEYSNAQVKRIREMMDEFGTLAALKIRAAYDNGEWEANQQREQMYIQASDLLRKLLECAKQEDCYLESIFHMAVDLARST